MAIRSRRYRDVPLVVRGSGRGSVSPPLPADALGGPAYTLSVEGTALLLSLGAPVVDGEGNRLGPVDVVLETDSRNPSAKHAILELYARHGLELPDTPTMALHQLDPSDGSGDGAGGPVSAPPAARLHAIACELQGRLSSEPGVNAVALTSRLPRTTHSRGWVEMDEGPRATPLTSRGYPVSSARVDPGYFEVMGAPLLAGTRFASTDTSGGASEGARGTVMVNRSFVERVLGGGNAVGRRLRYWGDGPRPWYEIVGVVPDLGTVYEDPTNLAGVYHPISTATTPLYLAIHARGGPKALTPRVRALATDVDPALRLHDILPLDEVGATPWLELQFLFRLLLGMSAVALLLSLAGIYATTAFAVERRRREIGIRVALGAGAPRVLRAVLAGPLAQVGVGVFAGGCLTAALALAIIRGALWPRGVLWVAAYAVLMMAVCLLACVVPTRRALAVQPSEALRADG